MIPLLARRLVGNASVVALARGQRSLPYATRHAIERLRDARVRRMVRYAAATVPFYRDAFREAGLDARDIRTARDLERLPLVEKDDLRRDPDRFVSTSRAGRNSIAFDTSGSTGMRARIHHDRRSMLANIAYGERERAVITRFLGRTTGYREARIGYNGGTLERVTKFYRDSTWIPGRPDRLHLWVTEPLAANVDALNRFRPDVLFGYSSYLVAIARHVAAGKLVVERPKLVIYGAEPLSAGERLEVEQAFGAPVISRYTAVEVFKIAFMCERRDGFHVHEDLAHLRIVGSDGNTVPDGQSGTIVVSNLVNRGTVLLNYLMTDLARWNDEPCACGRTLRRLAEVDGRLEDLLHLPNGDVLHPRGIWGLLKPHPEVLQYQLVQREPMRFLLKLVTASGGDYERVAPGVAREMAAALGTGTTVETERCAELSREAGGKVRMVVALPGQPPA